MSESVKKNYLYNILYEILVLIIPLITAPYLSRILGSERIGEYTFSYSIVSYFILFGRLGIVNHGCREIAKITSKIERSRFFLSLITIQFASFLLVLLGYCVYLFLEVEIEQRLLTTILTIQIIAAAIDVNWFFWGRENFKLTVTRNILVKLINTLCIFIFIKTKDDLCAYAFILALFQFLGQIVIWYPLKNEIVFTPISWKDILYHLRPVCVLFIPTIAVSLYKLMDKIMLGALAGKTELSYYEYGSLFVGIPLSLITSLGVVMLPRISSFAEKGLHSSNKIYLKYSMLFVIALSFSMSAGISAIAPTLIPWYLGKDFVSCVPVLIGLSSTLVFLSWANVVRTQYLIPYRHDKEFIISLFCGAAINLILNWFLIPKYQSMGAVVGTVAAEFFVCFLQTFFSKDFLEVKVYFRYVGYFLLNAIAIFVTVRLVSHNSFLPIFSLILQISTGIIVTALFCFIFLKYYFKVGMHDIIQFATHIKL